MIKWINKKRNQKGFTLIELVVVIAILGILAALAIPRLTSSRDSANRKTILADLRTIESAIAIAQAEDVTLTETNDATFYGLVSDYLAVKPKGPGNEVYKIVDDRATVEIVKVYGSEKIEAGDHTLDTLLADDSDW